jgi:hypothetical protein
MAYLDVFLRHFRPPSKTRKLKFKSPFSPSRRAKLERDFSARREPWPTRTSGIGSWTKSTRLGRPIIDPESLELDHVHQFRCEHKADGSTPTERAPAALPTPSGSTTATRPFWNSPAARLRPPRTAISGARRWTRSWPTSRWPPAARPTSAGRWPTGRGRYGAASTNVTTLASQKVYQAFGEVYSEKQEVVRGRGHPKVGR